MMTKINVGKALKLRKKLEEEGKVIPGVFDAMFKEVMKGCPNYLADLLYQIIGIEKEVTLANLVIQDTELKTSHILEKRKRSDVIIRVEDHIINLEMNEEYYDGLYEKNDSYLRRIGSEGIEIGQKYQEKTIIQINFDNFEPFDERLIISFKMMDPERKVVENENYIKYHINLEKVREKYYNEEERENLTKLEKELLILVLEKKEEIKEISKGEEELMEAGRKIEDMSFDINMIGLYDEEEDRKITNELKMRYKLKKAEEEGLKSGLEKGIQQGIEQEIEQGEEKRSLEIAKNLLKKGIEKKTICECTNLSIEELNHLRIE